MIKLNFIRTYTKLVLRRWYVVAALAIVAFAAVVRLQASIMPDAVSVPTPTMPSPNARGYYTAARALERDPSLVDFAVSGLTAVPPGVDPKLAADPMNGYHVFTLAERDRLVAENVPAIAKLHEGMTYAYMQPPMRSFHDVIPYLAGDRSMARLLSTVGQTRAAHGDWAGAMDAYLDCIKLGSDDHRGAEIIGMLVGIACEAIGRKHAGDAIDHLTSTQARSDAVRLQQIEANETPVAQNLQDEEWFTQSSLQKLFADPHWRTWVTGNTNQESDTPSDDGEGILDKIALHAESPRVAFDNYTRYMNEAISQSKLSWPAQLAAVKPELPSDPMNRILLPLFAQACYKQYATVALDRLLETQLALRAYELDHGRYPDSLAQLAPKYLPSVPQDPFTDGLPLKCHLNDDGYLLYSVGPDVNDDGGKPMYDPTRSTSKYSAMWSSSEWGNIVAGVNY
jgi:hypothetical protein